MFSCCCGNVDFSWRPVCNCSITAGGRKTCNQGCLEDTLINEKSYFRAAEKIAEDLLKEHKEASVWFTGHSLGAAIASLLTARFYTEYSNRVSGLMFESPGERLYSRRLRLLKGNLTLEENLPIYHVLNDGDPIPFGACMGKFSSCYFAGYAMETKCHLGTTLKRN